MEKYPGKKKIAVFISGRGSNLKSLIKFSKKKNSLFKILLVISNNPKAGGLNYAKKSKIKNFGIRYTNKTKFENQSLKPVLASETAREQWEGKRAISSWF